MDDSVGICNKQTSMARWLFVMLHLIILVQMATSLDIYNNTLGARGKRFIPADRHYDNGPSWMGRIFGINWGGDTDGSSGGGGYRRELQTDQFYSTPRSEKKAINRNFDSDDYEDYEDKQNGLKDRRGRPFNKEKRVPGSLLFIFLLIVCVCVVLIIIEVNYNVLDSFCTRLDTNISPIETNRSRSRKSKRKSRKRKRFKDNDDNDEENEENDSDDDVDDMIRRSKRKAKSKHRKNRRKHRRRQLEDDDDDSEYEDLANK